jgi:hypothetical protein
MYLVHFDSSININVLSHNHRIIDGIIVKWENLKKSQNHVTQCFNCQRWGHASINCGLPSRCVKCTDSHAKGECSRNSRDGEPECCNCNGNHSANHRGCPVFKQYCERQNSRPRKVPAVPAHANHSQPINLSQFPILSQSSPVPGPSIVKGVSFSHKVKESQNNSIFDKISQAQERLRAVPMIQETFERFLHMVDEICSSSDPSDHLKIFVKYTLPTSFFNNGD